ncbi:aspartate:alanine exchanger family transporter [Austwickia chelonae]|uniref:aspartate:alanine exchanger family transporter n=1 Tax=Austwickia chelonae TaxID=100225 RepID=UPI000E283737|nr:TrkA C-terminal domain-containing protein [Austwickia chelonae]
MFTSLAQHTELLLFLVVGLGAAVGRIRVRGIALGSAAVLFVGIAIAAWGRSAGTTLEIPTSIGHIGLALFAFCVGISSGPNFFHTMRSSGKVVLGVVLSLVVGAVVAVGLGPVFGLTREQAVGTFAGALTNTPALAAAGDSSQATVGYSIAYLFGVIGMLAVSNLALRRRHNDPDTPVELIRTDIRVEREDQPHVRDVEEDHANQISITRVRHEESGPTRVANARTPLQRNDVVTVVGPPEYVHKVVTALGHESSHRLELDRRELDFRRITVSDPAVCGRSLRRLDLEGRFSGVISRVRRGDVDILGHPDLVLQLGDRIRVVAPRERLADIAAFFGDSSRGLTDINPVAVGLGMAFGIALGSIPIPLPGGSTFTLGPALGALLVGLVLGRIGRIGSVVTMLPFTASAVIAELGLLLFLAQAGTRAGGQISVAFTSGSWLGMVLLGALITLSTGMTAYLFQRRVVRMGGTRLAGLLAGLQTQPALLGYANTQTGQDFRVSAGYAMAYPTAMVVKILLASLIALP